MPLIAAALLLGCGNVGASEDPAPTPAVAVPHPFADREVKGAAGLPDRPATRPDEVVVQCFVVQGNGYNWAATLGWLSGQVRLAALRAGAREAAAPGTEVAIDLGCMTGSSSGSAATTLFDHLLGNPNLTGGGGTPGPVSAAQAHRISEALMFLALSANFRGEAVGLALAAPFAWAGVAERDSDAAAARLWRAQTTAPRNLRIFARWVQAAAAYHPDWFAELVGDDPVAIPAYTMRAGALPPDDREAAAERLDALATRARRILDARLGDGAPPVKAPGDGFCVTALAQPYRGSPPPFDLAELRLIAICNPATIARLLDSADLATWLGHAPRMGTRLLLAQSRDWATMANLSIREPNLVRVLSGPLRAPPIALDAVWRFDGGGFTPSGLPEDVVIFGGFAGPRLQAWPATALVAARVRTHRAEGRRAEGRLAIFGRTENRADPGETFAQRTIATFFSPARASGDAADAAAALAEFYAWQDAYCPVAEDPALPLEVGFYRMDWNLTSLPGAVTKRSGSLAALGFNLVGIQTGGTVPPAFAGGGFLFAAEDAEAFVPSPPPGGMTCRRGGGAGPG